MSTKIVTREIHRFLASQQAEVLCIRGKWGVGKTFAWRHALETATHQRSLTTKRYAYVSLFGLNSLSDLRQAIFESTVPATKALSGPTPETLSQLAKDELGGQKWAGWLPSLVGAFGFGAVSDVLARSAFLTIRNQTICIDDMERVGEGLRPRDILGLISFLKEQRNCRVAILLNDEAMSKPDQADFNRFLEKVVDVTLAYDPTPTEAVDIAITADDDISTYLRKCLPVLGITNIRAIQKIGILAGKAGELLQPFRIEIREQATLACALGSWALLEPDTAPGYEFLYNYNSLLLDIRKKKEEAEPDFTAWRDTLHAVEFTGASDFDRLLFDGAKVGYFDEQRLIAEAKSIEEDLNRSTRVSSFSEAWRRYRSSLAVDDDEILDQIHRATHECLTEISPSELNATILLLRRHNRGQQADDLIPAYVAAKAEIPNFFDLSRHTFFRVDEIDPALQAAFQQQHAAYVDPRNPRDVLVELASRTAWNDEDVRLLAGVSADDYEQMFESIESDELGRIVETALRLAGQQDQHSLTMRAAVHEALSRIARKSPLRAERLAVWGFKVESGQP